MVNRSIVAVSAAGGSATSYRFGFNYQEQDDEITGDGNSNSTDFRQLDLRLGRWFSIDPLAPKFAWQSPYVAFNNNSIRFVDYLGLEGDDKVAPAGHTEHTAADGSKIPVTLILTSDKRLIDLYGNYTVADVRSNKN